MNQFSRRDALQALLASSSTWLSGCGGGSDEAETIAEAAGTPAVQPTTPPAPAPAPAPTPGPAPAPAPGPAPAPAPAPAPSAPVSRNPTWPAVVPANRGAWPQWRRAMASHTWAMLPASNTLADIDPGRNPAITPANADYLGRGMTAGLLAWTGGVWDDESGTFWIPLGGGHSDYGGNEPYRIKLDVDTPAWVMVRNPSGAIGNIGIARDGLDRSGVYFDGRLRAVHSYNNQTFVPGLGPVISRLQGCYYSGYPATKRAAYRIDAAGEAHLLCDYTAQNASNPAISTDDGVCAYDPTRGARGTLWSLGHATSKLIAIDLAAGTARVRGVADNHLASCDAMHYIPGMDVLAGINRGALKIWHIDQDSFTGLSPTLSGSYSAGLVIENLVGFGSCWAPEIRQLCLYENPTNNRGQISTLTPTGGGTHPWIRGVLNVSSSNTVLPPAGGSDGGLFGRFGYSSKLRGFFLVPSTRHNPYFFATE